MGSRVRNTSIVPSRRSSTPPYGSLIVFYFSGLTMTALLRKNLKDAVSWERHRGSYDDVLPYVLNAFSWALDEFDTLVHGDFLRRELRSLITHLCHPIPTKRAYGPPGVAGTSNDMWRPRGQKMRCARSTSRAEQRVRSVWQLRRILGDCNKAARRLRPPESRDLPALQREYQLARSHRPQAHTVAAGPVQFSFNVSRPTVRMVRARPKFTRWPMQGLKWLGKEVLRAGLREAIREILDDALSELFRRRTARAGVG